MNWDIKYIKLKPQTTFDIESLNFSINSECHTPHVSLRNGAYWSSYTEHLTIPHAYTTMFQHVTIQSHTTYIIQPLLIYIYVYVCLIRELELNTIETTANKHMCTNIYLELSIIYEVMMPALAFTIYAVVRHVSWAVVSSQRSPTEYAVRQLLCY